MIADKYRAVRFVKTDGKIVTGLVISEDDDAVTISADPQHPDMLVTINKKDIDEQSPSPISTMPEDLLNTLELEEILDLMAIIESGGDAKREHFKQP